MIDDDEEKEEDEKVKLKHKAQDVVLDENLWIAREAEVREKDLRDALTALEAKNFLIPSCSMEIILTKAINNPCLR